MGIAADDHQRGRKVAAAHSQTAQISEAAPHPPGLGTAYSASNFALAADRAALLQYTRLRSSLILMRSDTHSLEVSKIIIISNSLNSRRETNYVGKFLKIKTI
jgi:hypothetical protein